MIELASGKKGALKSAVGPITKQDKALTMANIRSG
jgi:hypothetical protein